MSYDYTPVEELRELVREVALRASRDPGVAIGNRWVALGPDLFRRIREAARRDMLAHAAETYEAETADIGGRS